MFWTRTLTGAFYLKRETMKTLESLSNKLFEYTIIHHDTIDILALKIGIPVNALARIQSENKFVNPKSILLVQKFFDEKDELWK